MFSEDHVKIAVFADVQYLYHAAKKSCDGKVRFGALLNSIVRERKLVTANSYISGSKRKQEAFVYSLVKYGWSVKDNENRGAFPEQNGDWNVGIACDVFRAIENNEINVVVLVTGDDNFIDLVEFIRSRGIKVEVWGFPKTTSRNLISIVRDEGGFYEITEDLVFVDTKPHTDELDENFVEDDIDE